MAITNINDASFDKAVSSGISLVDFWAPWCGPCQMFGPTFESASDKETGVNFYKFEIDEANRQSPTKYGIRSIPSILAFKDGELIEARAGVMDEDTLLSWVAELKG